MTESNVSFKTCFFVQMSIFSGLSVCFAKVREVNQFFLRVKKYDIENNTF